MGAACIAEKKTCPVKINQCLEKNKTHKGNFLGSGTLQNVDNNTEVTMRLNLVMCIFLHVCIHYLVYSGSIQLTCKYMLMSMQHTHI